MKYEFRQTAPAGFTIVELLVAVLMSGILAAIAAPSWQGFAASRRADTAQNEILQTLRQAQADAIRTRRSQTVTFNPTVTPPTIQVGSRSPVRLGEETTQAQLRPGILSLAVSNSSTTPNNVVEFDSRGTVTKGVNMIITATSAGNSNRKRCVIVETLLGTLRTAQNSDCNSI